MKFTTAALASLSVSQALAASIYQPVGQHPVKPVEASVPPVDRFLVRTSPTETQWVTEDEKWALRREGINFIDITNDPEMDPLHAVAKVEFPSYPAYNDSIRPYFKSLDQSNMRKNLEKFTSFHTRYYKSATGAQSGNWLFAQVKDIVEKAGAIKHGATVKQFKHPWGQNSVIASIPGKSNKTVVVGAHQDSINLFLPSLLAAPGADDDGSGTVTILEALRVLLQERKIVEGNASNTIEFHWYSAEEGGLLGSKAVFTSYQANGRDVKAMLQQDMTGYIQNTLDAGEPESVGVITDYVDEGLTTFIKKVVTEYCDIPYVETKCGYACSDHASASAAGYPSAFVIESDFKYSDKKIHTTEDKIEFLSFEHMLQHAKLTLAFAYELAFAKF